jgi:hypothetical protein
VTFFTEGANDFVFCFAWFTFSIRTRFAFVFLLFFVRFLQSIYTFSEEEVTIGNKNSLSFNVDAESYLCFFGRGVNFAVQHGVGERGEHPCEAGSRLHARGLELVPSDDGPPRGGLEARDGAAAVLGRGESAQQSAHGGSALGPAAAAKRASNERGGNVGRPVQPSSQSSVTTTLRECQQRRRQQQTSKQMTKISIRKTPHTTNKQHPPSATARLVPRPRFTTPTHTVRTMLNIRRNQTRLQFIVYNFFTKNTQNGNL